MTQFHEGQEVEVAQDFLRNDGIAPHCWRRAKILTVSRPNEPPQTASVIFPDGISAVFNAEHIRVVISEKDYDPEGFNQSIRDQLTNQR
jgi:hypothetical protein